MRLIDLLTEAKDKKIKCNHCDWSWKESEGGKEKYLCHKCGHDNTPKSFDEFAETRMKGADKIATTAKEKGGFAMLTYSGKKFDFLTGLRVEHTYLIETSDTLTNELVS